MGKMLDVEKVLLELIEVVARFIHKVKRGNPDAADQLIRALNSALSNTGEGARRCGADSANRYRIAGGEAREALNQLCAAKAWGWVTPEERDAAVALADRACAMLFRLKEAATRPAQRA